MTERELLELATWTFVYSFFIDAPIDWSWWTFACCHYDGTVSPKLIAAEIAESMSYEGV